MTLTPGAGVVVEIAFATAPDATPTWVDVTQYVMMNPGITITRGTSPEGSRDVPPGICTMTLKNDDGRFTAGNTSSPYYPNVKLRRRLRVTVQSSVRFTGFVDSWPTEWEAPAVSRAQIVAVDRLKRLGRQMPMRSIISEELGADDPIGHYPLGEAEESTVAVDASSAARLTSMSVVQYGSGGTIAFGTGTGVGTDGLPAPVFTPQDANNGKALRATLAGATVINPSLSGITMEVGVRTTTTRRRIATLFGPDGEFLALSVATGGELQWMAWTGNSIGTQSATSTNIADGLTHYIGMTVVDSGASGIDIRLYLDGALVVTNLTPGVFNSGLPLFERFELGGNRLVEDFETVGFMFEGTLCHAALFDSVLSDARMEDHAGAVLSGFAGERSDERVARYARFAGVATADMTLDVGSSTNIEHIDSTDSFALDLANQVTRTENGRLFIDRAGELIFHSRARRYNAAVALTATSAEVRPGVAFSLDDRTLVNDVTGKRQFGNAYRATDDASFSYYGPARGELSLVTASDSEVIDAVHWELALNAEPSSRMPNFSIDLLSQDAIRTAALALDISSKVRITTLPSQAPASSVDIFVEGYTETISATAWDLSLNASPAGSQFSVWALGTAGASELGTTTRLAY